MCVLNYFYLELPDVVKSNNFRKSPSNSQKTGRTRYGVPNANVLPTLPMMLTMMSPLPEALIRKQSLNLPRRQDEEVPNNNKLLVRPSVSPTPEKVSPQNGERKRKKFRRSRRCTTEQVRKHSEKTHSE